MGLPANSNQTIRWWGESVIRYFGVGDTYTSVTLTRFVHIISWHLGFRIFRLGSVTVAYEISLPIFRLETFVCQPLLGKFGLDMSRGNVRLRSSDFKHPLDKIGFLSVVWKLSPGIFRLIFSAGMSRLGSLV